MQFPRRNNEWLRRLCQEWFTAAESAQINTAEGAPSLSNGRSRRKSGVSHEAMPRYGSDLAPARRQRGSVTVEVDEADDREGRRCPTLLFPLRQKLFAWLQQRRGKALF